MIIYRDSGGFGRGEEIPVEVGVQVTARFEGANAVECSSTPAGAVATALHVGPYNRLGATHAAVRRWRRENNRAVTGLNWEVYGDWNDDQSKLETRVFYLLS